MNRDDQMETPAEIVDRSPEIISEIEGEYEIWELVFLLVFGTERLGVFKENPEMTASLLDSQTVEDDGEKEDFVASVSKEPYKDPSLYPVIERMGSDNEEVIWTPYFISPENHLKNNPGCRSGLIYFPDTRRPEAILPDFQALMHSNLPYVDPVLAPVDLVDGWAYAQVPMDFGATVASLRRPEAYSEIPDILNGGTLWIEAVAIPERFQFDPGDGHDPVTCDVDESWVYDPAVVSPCSYTYLDASSIAHGGVFDATLSISWRGEYTTNYGPDGTFFIPPSTTTFEVQVAETVPLVISAG